MMVARITIDAAPAHEVSLMLRIPGWCDDASLSINEEASDAPLDGRELRRAAARLEERRYVIELRLPMRPRLIKAHPKAEEIRNHVAVMRGPIVYCLEGLTCPMRFRFSMSTRPMTCV